MSVSLAVFSQDFRATLTGRVIDGAGAAVPNAKVKATNAATGETREATTDSQGNYHIPSLTPAGYSVKAEAQGFKTAVKEGLQLNVNQTAKTILGVFRCHASHGGPRCGIRASWPNWPLWQRCMRRFRGSPQIFWLLRRSLEAERTSNHGNDGSSRSQSRRSARRSSPINGRRAHRHLILRGAIFDVSLSSIALARIDLATSHSD